MLKYLNGFMWFFWTMFALLLFSMSSKMNPGYGFIPGSALPIVARAILIMSILLAIRWVLQDTKLYRKLKTLLGIK